jgi:lipoate---protein ligase
MLLIDYSERTPQANLAFEEALLESVDPVQLDPIAALPEYSHLELEALRLWEMPELCVVMGRGSKIAEVHQSSCEQDRIPILKRCSGGASVVAGPGCLMYSLRLSLEARPALRSIDAGHAWVMQRVAQAVSMVVPDIQLQGTCDLTLDNRKFSGNAVRYKRDWMLYHGTLLYRFPLEHIPQYLQMPPRQPLYRDSRIHADFLVNLDCDPASLRSAFKTVWQADQPWVSHPHAVTLRSTAQRLLDTKYSI